MQLSSVMIFVRDMPVMKAFYRDVLGLTLLEENPEGTWVTFQTEGAPLALHAIPPEIARDIVIETPAQPRTTSPVKLIFSVTDLEAEQARLRSLGVPLLPRPWGVCDAIDPEGNIFQLRPAGK